MLYGPGRYSRQKRFGTLHTLEGRLKISDVSLEGRMAYKRERARADHLSAPQVASAGKVFWELLGVAAIDPRQRVPWCACAFCVAAETLATSVAYRDGTLSGDPIHIEGRDLVIAVERA